MANGTSGTRGSSAASGAAAKAGQTPDLTAAAAYLDNQTVNLINAVNNNNTDLTAPQNSGVSLTISGGIENAIKNAANLDIHTGSNQIESVLNAAPIGTLIEKDAYHHSTEGMLQNQWKKVGANTWEHTWRVKDGKVFWKNNDKVGKAADAIWNSYQPDIY